MFGLRRRVRIAETNAANSRHLAEMWKREAERLREENDRLRSPKPVKVQFNASGIDAEQVTQYMASHNID